MNHFYDLESYSSFQNIAAAYKIHKIIWEGETPNAWLQIDMKCFKTCPIF